MQRGERQKLDEGQRARGIAEAKARNARLRGGVMGIWDRLTGRRRETIRFNEEEARQAVIRDRGERDGLVADQLDARRTVQRDIIAVRSRYADQVVELYRDLADQHESREQEPPSASFHRAATTLRRTERSRGAMRGRGPELGR